MRAADDQVLRRAPTFLKPDVVIRVQRIPVERVLDAVAPTEVDDHAILRF